ncbi:hypothetical protein L6452_20833 [Arctium lappa]|uniref:Uncharacterized protein n=1 Tax=Arctium lappa TaxID=4217 RepID=A0ACB9BC03_ARCLA|nr:hypothetical protein L6452_20833 [Arctium lappa]
MEGSANVRPLWTCFKRTSHGKKFSGSGGGSLDYRMTQEKRFLLKVLNLLQDVISELLTSSNKDSEGSQDLYPSHHSDDPDITSMNNKFSSYERIYP